MPSLVGLDGDRIELGQNAGILATPKGAIGLLAEAVSLALVAGRNLLPSPATGNTAFLTVFVSTIVLYVNTLI